ncbi:uncharacterized protein LOC117297706 [Asterias rubens]|uniref:uncharacterized protein LOC117297706 n=1 Tax=Asterias rubens TaxID=7604 RepID=UPI00145588D9|nr:uncharacterized protein LOC117297706 [Asterias rubens]
MVNQSSKDYLFWWSPFWLIPLLLLIVLVPRLTVAQTLQQNVLSQPVNLWQLYEQDIATVTVAPEDATCGMQEKEMICSMNFFQTDPVICEYCLASNESISHPPSLILDPNDQTYWQSSPWHSYPAPYIVNITISLRDKKKYIFTGDIVLRFKSVPQEVAMRLEKSQDGGITWQIYQYFSTNCTKDFNMSETESNWNMKNVLDVTCANPSLTQQTSNLTEFRFDLEGRINAIVASGGGSWEYFYQELEKQESLRDFLMVTDLRLVMMRTQSDEKDAGTGRERMHYAIYSVDANLRCDCNGHGTYCVLVPSERRVQCNCVHNTDGQSCHRCMAGYQASPWQAGSYLPFPGGTANECKVSPTQETNISTQPPNDADPRACTPSPCLNGRCIPEETAAGYKCSCDIGYAGYSCEINLNPCRSNPCAELNEACVSERYNHYQCVPWASINGTEPPVITTPVPLNTGLIGPTIGIIIGALLAVCLFCLWIVLIVWCTTWRHLHGSDKFNLKYADEAENKYSNNTYKMGGAKSWLVPDGRSSMRAHKVRDRWIIDETLLDLGKLIYSGEFSYICEGTYKNKEKDTSSKVVVKLLRDEKDTDSLNELQNEFEVMACMGRHPNIVWLQGTCSRVLEETTQTCLVNEFVARGDMLRILRRGRCRRRDQPPYSPTPVDELLGFACDIAQGMRHITLLKYVHMNLCAKNVFITFNNKAKIGDFGMAKELPESSGYVRYTEHRNKHIKRWMAYEALCEDIYSVKSEVWSFGIVLWEIITLGGMPYHNIKTADLVSELRDHTRMEWPRHCSPEIFDLMLRCWHRRPESRPSFDMLYTEIKKMKTMAKKHFNLKDYTYQNYVPVKLEEDLVMDSVQDSTFV